MFTCVLKKNKVSPTNLFNTATAIHQQTHQQTNTHDRIKHYTILLLLW